MPENKCPHTGKYAPVGQLEAHNPGGMTVFISMICTECGAAMIRAVELKGIGKVQAMPTMPINLPKFKGVN